MAIEVAKKMELDARTQQLLESRKKDRILGEASSAGIQAGLAAVGLVGAGVVAASKFYPRFRNAQISTKVSLPTMAGLFMFSLQYELTLISMQRDGHKHEDLKKENLLENRVSNMPIHHRAANYLYDHPFVMISSFGFPFASYVLNSQLKLKHLTISQRVMHSRVIAQAGILTMAMTTMAFREYMDKRGRFPGDR
tara:strand:+ start:240 stop:824 length:585 start_codon:yes stop_codon:yes gene_type:complete